MFLISLSLTFDISFSFYKSILNTFSDVSIILISSNFTHISSNWTDLRLNAPNNLLNSFLFFSCSVSPSKFSWNFSSFNLEMTDSISLEFFSGFTIYFVVYSLSRIGSKASCISLFEFKVRKANLKNELIYWSFLIEFISML